MFGISKKFWTIKSISLGVIAVLFVLVGRVSAQDGPYPSDRYFAGEIFLFKADPNSARAFYEEELKNSLRIGPKRWIDSICYYTMLGESFYMSGDLRSALECYNNAVMLHAQYPQWLARVEYAVGIQDAARTAFSVPWGPGMRTNALRIFPRNATITLGDVLTKERIQQGGMISQLKMVRINPMEILRCLTLSMRRRIDILGPMIDYDELSPAILETFRVRSVPANHWSVTSLDVLFGLALEGVGKKNEARDIFKSSVVTSNQTDHPLTATAFYELGRLQIGAGKFTEAAACFYESSISAFQYKDSFLQEDALRKMFGLKKTFEPTKENSVLTRAFNWFRTNMSDQSYIFISLSEELIEDLIRRGDFKAAQTGLKTVEHFIQSSRALKNSDMADRYFYLQALMAYAQLRVSDGDSAIKIMLEGRKLHSPRILQFKLLDIISRSGKISSSGPFTLRNITELYGSMLRHPDDADWILSPMDAIVAEMFTPPEAYEQWFLLLCKRDMKDKAFEASEEARAKRFLDGQILGNRLISLRYLLEAPEKMLPADVQLNKQNILVDYPAIKDLSAKMADCKVELRKIPVTVSDEKNKKFQKTLFAQLDALSRQQEAQLRLVAASRMTIPTIFPPLRPLENIRANLKEDTSLLVFFQAYGDMFGFMITKKDVDFWRIGSVGNVQASVISFLKTLGCSDGNRAITFKDLTSDKWRQEGQKLLELLLGDPKSGGARFSTVFKELVIVPDGVLWYLPFEALSLASKDSESVPLILMPGITIRYAPTANLGLPGVIGRSIMSETAIVPGKLFSKEQDKFTDRELARLSGKIQKAEIVDVKSISVPTAVFVSRLDRLINLNEISGLRQINWVPVATGNDVFNQVYFWGNLPWGAPRLMIYPGFRSPAENALKNGGNGSEFFYPIMQMLSTGGESVLISRWRIGGKTSFDLVNSFMKYKESMPIAEAWKQSVHDLQENNFVPNEEIRLGKFNSKQTLPKVTHPLFWGGYMLIDPGEPVDKRVETVTTGAANFDSSKPADPNAKPAAGINPADPNAKPAAGVKPADPNAKPAAGVNPADPNAKPAAGVDPADPNAKPAAGINPTDPNADDKKKDLSKNGKNRKSRNTKKKKNDTASGSDSADSVNSVKSISVDQLENVPASKNSSGANKKETVPENKMTEESPENGSVNSKDDEAPGVVPVITVKDPDDGQPAAGAQGSDTGKKKTDPKTSGSNQNVGGASKSDEKKTPESQGEKKNELSSDLIKPSGSKKPVTDDQLQKEDEEADDFYKDK